MSKKISMEDIARELGISKNTVSLALRGMPGINNETRQLIIDKAKTLGYSYKKSSEACKNICLIQSRNTENSMVGFFNFIQFGIEAEAKQNGINVIIHYYDEAEEDFEIPLSIKEGMISGILTLGRISRKTISRLIELNIPLVMLDHYFDNINLNYILSDNISSAYRAAEYLIKKGHKKIGFIGNIKASISFYDRYQGFLKALFEHGLEFNKLHAFDFISMEDLAQSNCPLLIEKLSGLSDLPDAFFCCNDAEAITLTRALSSIGLRVPEDISVMGFDDIEFAKNMTPELTTMRVEKELMGIKAVERLLSLMETDSGPTEKLLIQTTLVERKSVKDIKL